MQTAFMYIAKPVNVVAAQATSRKSFTPAIQPLLGARQEQFFWI